MHAAAIDESTIQTWAVRRDRQVKAGIAVSALPATPKAGTTPFGGSQLCFALTEDGVLVPTPGNVTSLSCFAGQACDNEHTCAAQGQPVA